ncbi:MAG: hypothetical protein NTY19_16835 [Planctomycetota bacterium]|nr:hypothetical protein [Planctomycetota bacterium]
MLTVDQLGRFDGIVLGELVPGKWMAGSDNGRRTLREQQACAVETADAQTVVQLAIVYRGHEVTIYRNGTPYAQYSVQRPQWFPVGTEIYMGKHHAWAGDMPCFAGTIDDARVYNVALSAEQIAGLRPNQPSDPPPFAWWTFDDDTATERMGNFRTELTGGARVADGRLHMDGKGACLVARRNLDPLFRLTQPVRVRAPFHFRPREGNYGDPIPFFWKGTYHVFYLRGGLPTVPWEHIVSTDLVRWKELPTALRADGDPEGFDGWSQATGSVFEKDGVFHIFYCGMNPKNPRGRESICHATSPDLIRWTKHPADRIDPDGIHYSNQRNRDFRDPYVLWNEEEQQYWMVPTATSLTGGGPGLLVSKDFKTWQQVQALDAVNQDCPDLFKIGDTWYLLGANTYRHSKKSRGPFGNPAFNNEIDQPCIRAGKRMFDGQRHVWVGWLWDHVPACDAGNGGWGGDQCLPRELYPGPSGQLFCRPIPEVLAVFAQTVCDLATRPPLAAVSGHWQYEETGLVGRGDAAGARCALTVPDHYLLQCKLQLDPQAVFTLTMRQTDEPDSGYRLTLRPQQQEAEIGCEAFFYPRSIGLDATKPITIRAFVQGSMIETFVNDQYAFSCRAYDYQTGKLGLSVSGGAATVTEFSVKVHEIPSSSAAFLFQPDAGVLADVIPFSWKDQYHLLYLQLKPGQKGFDWAQVVTRDFVDYECPDVFQVGQQWYLLFSTYAQNPG